MQDRKNGTTSRQRFAHFGAAGKSTSFPFFSLLFSFSMPSCPSSPKLLFLAAVLLSAAPLPELAPPGTNIVFPIDDAPTFCFLFVTPLPEAPFDSPRTLVSSHSVSSPPASLPGSKSCERVEYRAARRLVLLGCWEDRFRRGVGSWSCSLSERLEEKDEEALEEGGRAGVERKGLCDCRYDKEAHTIKSQPSPLVDAM
jgi:hypothetical protein